MAEVTVEPGALRWFSRSGFARSKSDPWYQESCTGIRLRTSGHSSCMCTFGDAKMYNNSVYSSGNARVTIFAAQSVASTFDYQGGDIGEYI